MNIYQPAQSSVTGILAPVNFANTVQFICSAIEAASRQGFEKSSKLCVQYLAPIIKNRQYNFPPLGINPFAGASARPNEITYSENPTESQPAAAAAGGCPCAAGASARTTACGSAAALAPAATPTDPSQGLEGLMVPPAAIAPEGTP